MASWIVMVVAAYIVIGAIFSVAFVAKGVGVIDPVAEKSGWGFRVLLFPGAAALWPLLLKKWVLA